MVASISLTCSEAFEHAAVQLAQQVELGCAGRAGSLRGRFEIGHGCAALAEQRALIAGRQKAAAEAVHAAGRNQAAVEHDEAGQILADRCPAHS